MVSDETAQPGQSDKPTRAKRVNPSDVFKKPFLIAYEELENQTLAAKKVGVDPDTVTKWKKDEAFRQLFVQAHIRAQQKNNDLLRSSMLQRAVRGNPHYLIRNGVIQRNEKGEPIVAYYEQETQLTLFMAKNRMPNEFRDKFELEITGKIVQMLVTEFFGILRRRLQPAQLIPIQQELETTVAKLSTRT